MELKKELELACLENELVFLKPQSDEDQELTDRLLLVPEDENVIKNQTEKQKAMKKVHIFQVFTMSSHLI